MAGSGHIAGVVNPPSSGKYQYWTGGKPQGEFEDWVAKAKEHPGSWWPHWQAGSSARTRGAWRRARSAQARPCYAMLRVNMFASASEAESPAGQPVTSGP
jgi:poly(3-hydroxyalkanoate) synthetase